MAPLMAKGSEMSKKGYEGLNCAVCGRPVPLSGESFQAETDVATGEARIWHSNCGRPRLAVTPSAVVYTTTDDEREAREIAESLAPRRAIVMGVNFMHLTRDPLAPRTTDRFAVIAERVSGS